MSNLKEETLEALKQHGKAWNDVSSIVSDDYQIDKTVFLQAADVEYDDGYGAAKVAEDLKIFGAGFVMIRHEYDGSERWKYVDIDPAKKPWLVNPRLVVREDQVGWKTLANINDGAKSVIATPNELENSSEVED